MNARHLRLRVITLMCGLGFAVLGNQAHAFSDDEARRAILDLRSQIQQMQQSDLNARLQLADQIQGLQQQIMQLRDQVELLSHQQSQNNAPAQGNGPSAPQAGSPPEQTAYNGAVDLFSHGQYAQASQALAQFVGTYPNSQLVPQAMFYQGSSQYASKDYRGAIGTLKTLVSKYPDNDRAPNALLVMAGSQIEINDHAGAKASLQRIVQQYPTSSAADAAKSRLKLLQ